MDRVEYYSGEPSGSPELFDPTDNSGQFALNARDIYGSNPAPAMQYNPYQNYQQPMQPSPNFMNPPGQINFGYGYNYGGYPQQPMYPQQPVYGAPMNYPNMNGQYGAQTIDPSRINTGYVGNPAIGLLNQWQQQGTPYQGPNGYYNPYTQTVNYVPTMPVQTQDRVVTVPGYSPSGDIGMLTSDAKEVCEQMQVDMMYEQQQAIARRQQRSQGIFNANLMGYANYYGTPYINSYYDNTVYNKYMDKIREMKDEAIARRTRLNKRLSMICHNYLKDGVTESDIDKIYDGYTYTIPGTSVVEYQTQEKLARLVPFNNAHLYQEHSRMVTKAYQMIATPGHNLNEFLADCAMFKIMDNMEKEYHRRRNTQNYFDTDIYHEYMRKYALEHDIELQNQQRDKEMAKKLTDLTLQKQGDVTKQDIMNVLYPPEKVQELRNNGFIINPDGTTEIKPPDYLFNNNNSAPRPEIRSENEIDYEMRRSAFIASIYDNNRSQVGG